MTNRWSGPDPRIPIATGAGEQLQPAVASDGTNSLCGVDSTGGSPATDIRGAQVGPSGSVLDPGGFTISTAANSQSLAALTFDDGELARGLGEPALGQLRHLRGPGDPVRDVLDPTGRAISRAARNQTAPAVAFDGTHSLVVWSDRRAGTTFDVYAAESTRSDRSSTRPGSLSHGDRQPDLSRRRFRRHRSCAG